MDLSIIIVTHNSRDQVQKCLASLDRYPASGSSEIIVVDNASSDGTPRMIEERFPGVSLDSNTENKGYSRGVNQGIAGATGRNMLILNPDIEVQENSIDRLLEFMDRTPDAGIAGSKLIYPDGTLQHSCRSFYTIRTLLLRRTFLGRLFPNARALRKHLMLDYDHEESRKVDWVLGACMLVRREAMEKVGLMDERFFLYFEDTDWCFRMKKMDWGVYYIPDSVMIHHYERSSAGSMLKLPFLIHLLSLLRYYEKWNRMSYFLRRNRGFLKFLLFMLGDLAALNASFFAAYWLRNLLQPFFERGLYPVSWYVVYIFFSNLIYFLALLYSGLYRIRRETSVRSEFSRIARAVLLGFVILLAATYLSRVRIHSRAVLLGQAALMVPAIFFMRQLLRAVHRTLVKARLDLKRTLLIGTPDEIADYTPRLVSSLDMGIDIVRITGDPASTPSALDEIVRIVDSLMIQEVYVLPSFQTDEFLDSLLERSKGKMIKIKAVSPLSHFAGSDVRVEGVGGVSLFSIERRSRR